MSRELLQVACYHYDVEFMIRILWRELAHSYGDPRQMGSQQLTGIWIRKNPYHPFGASVLDAIRVLCGLGPRLWGVSPYMFLSGLSNNMGLLTCPTISHYSGDLIRLYNVTKHHVLDHVSPGQSIRISTLDTKAQHWPCSRLCDYCATSALHHRRSSCLSADPTV